MEIPHTVTARPDTGLYNAKLGIWLFLASEVMLFGGLSRPTSSSGWARSRATGRAAAQRPGRYLQHGSAHPFIGDVIMAWVALKMRQFSKYKFYMLLTIICGSLFLFIKLA
jgi:cytochrome c oxidase subunit 3